jgi:hypothetical protein
VNLQSILDRGDDCLLEPRKIYEITEPLKFRKPGQQIATKGAQRIEDFATLRIGVGANVTLVDTLAHTGVKLERLILDGNRSQLLTADNKVPAQPMVSFGRKGGDNQIIRRCVVLNSRCGGGWGAIHVHEGAMGICIEDNIVFGSGVDVRGNGRSPKERPFGWGDGISTASRKSTIRNNLIIDVTDEGIMVQGAPGTIVEGNVVAAVSREMLAGIALIDPSMHYPLDAEKRRHNYRGVVVRNNWIDAFGSRIHVAVPLGGSPWSDELTGTTLVGAKIIGNKLTGRAGGYGIVANGIDEFEVTGNTSTASYSGIGDGLPGKPPEPPGAFLFDPAYIGASVLQKEFRPKSSQAHLIHLLRNYWRPAAPSGYRLADYGDAEALAVARAALIEMLGEEPSPESVNQWADWLKKTKGNADALRAQIAQTEAFRSRHGEHSEKVLETFRTDLWLTITQGEMESRPEKSGDDWPHAAQLYSLMIEALTNATYRKFLAE